MYDIFRKLYETRAHVSYFADERWSKYMKYGHSISRSNCILLCSLGRLRLWRSGERGPEAAASPAESCRQRQESSDAAAVHWRSAGVRGVRQQPAPHRQRCGGPAMSSGAAAALSRLHLLLRQPIGVPLSARGPSAVVSPAAAQDATTRTKGDRPRGGDAALSETKVFEAVALMAHLVRRSSH